MNMWNGHILVIPSCVSIVQFAGSLGKLTVSSVNNPRKMIDAVVTSRSDDEVPLFLFICLLFSSSHV